METGKDKDLIINMRKKLLHIERENVNLISLDNSKMMDLCKEYSNLQATLETCEMDKQKLLFDNLKLKQDLKILNEECQFKEISLEKKLQELNESYLRLDMNFNLLVQKNESLHEEITNLNSQISKKAEENTNLILKNDDQQIEMKKISFNCFQSHKHIHKLKKELKFLSGEIINKDLSIVNFEREISSLQSTIDGMRCELKSKEDLLNYQMLKERENQLTIDHLNLVLNKNKELHENEKLYYQKLEERYSNLETDFMKVKNNEDQLTSKMNLLNLDLIRKTKENKNVSGHLSGRNVKIIKLLEQIKLQEERIGHLSKMLKELKEIQGNNSNDKLL